MYGLKIARININTLVKGLAAAVISGTCTRTYLIREVLRQSFSLKVVYVELWKLNKEKTSHVTGTTKAGQIASGVATGESMYCSDGRLTCTVRWRKGCGGTRCRFHGQGS